MALQSRTMNVRAEDRWWVDFSLGHAFLALASTDLETSALPSPLSTMRLSQDCSKGIIFLVFLVLGQTQKKSSTSNCKLGR